MLDLLKTKIKVTDEGEQETSELITVYKYKLRADISGAPIIPGSRDFCIRLIGEVNKNYTIEEINFLSLEQGRNVFSKRGGWYTNPNTKIRTPYCRHVWSAKTVRLKKNAK